MRSLAHTLIEKSKKNAPFIVALSGIDGSGKGYVGQQLTDHIRSAGLSCELIGIDGWLQPPSKRFSTEDPARHFYENGFRFEEMQSQLLAPLRTVGRVDLVAQHADPTNAEPMVEFRYQIDRPDIILFEGIFLLQDRFRFDYSIWIDCSFETAMDRALARNQEGLPEDDIRRDYETIYFPAQRIHLERDNPRERCDFILLNDEQLSPS
ncbi:MAG: uridine kinase [Verrucomicrobiota bacterium]